MILGKDLITIAISLEDLRISDLCDESIQPASLDIRLGDSWATERTMSAIPREIGDLDMDSWNADVAVIAPGQFMLARSLEVIELPISLSARVDGRSSVGRSGLFVQNAGYIDPGFQGSITLELYNASKTPLLLRKGQRIAQLVFEDVAGAVAYSGRYQGQIEATMSRFNGGK